MTNDTLQPSAPARINGVPLHAMGDQLSSDELRQRACTELLRQAAQAAGLLDANDTPPTDGVISEAIGSLVVMATHIKKNGFRAFA